jgi:hypothetical protein
MNEEVMAHWGLSRQKKISSMSIYQRAGLTAQELIMTLAQYNNIIISLVATYIFM